MGTGRSYARIGARDGEEMSAYALSRTGDLFTSHAAAASVNVSAAEAVVLAALRAAGERGMTSHEIASATGRDLVSVSPRMRPLCEKGKVRADGRRDGRTVWSIA